MKTKISTILFLLLIALPAFAVEFKNAEPIPPTAWERCGLNIFCYFKPLFGAAFTTINTTDRIRDLPTTINANFALVNTGFVDMGTTSVDSITTLSNLVTIGTITSGTWNASTLSVLYGGTGSTTWPAANTVIYASSTNAMLGVPIGTEGQVLTLVNVGGTASLVPQWQDGGVNETLEYDWTGLHDWTATSTFAGVAAFSNLLMFGNGSATTTLNFSNTAQLSASTSVIGFNADGAVSILPLPHLLHASTTDNVTSTTASTTLLKIPLSSSELGDSGTIVGDIGFEFESGVLGSGNDSATLTLCFGQYEGNNNCTMVASSTNFYASGVSYSDGIYQGTLHFSVVYGGSSHEGTFSGTGAYVGANIQAIYINGRTYTSTASLSSSPVLSIEGKVDDSDASITFKNVSVQLVR